MSIYNQISSNKLRTYLIIFIFILLISGFFFLIGKYFENPTMYFTIGILVSLISSIGSYYYSDKIVLFTTGAKPADKKEHFDFYTVTENLAIASGLPMPKLYVMQDSAMNAFATGRDPKHAVVCATTGILEKLERAELEGVIAHELSHVKNYDILLASIVAVLVGTIAIVADWIMRSLWWGGHRDSKENRNPLMFALLIFALIITPIVATLIQLAVSRRREFLADATGALLTRYPEGLARALEKIAKDPRITAGATTSTAHMFIANPFKKKGATSWLATLFSTHPPAGERIKILRSM
ncbi:M48 family metallopeptidase [Candidatus Roizmanbacteria bacterium]|nr:M48 family metallopeptidase [Candidatus Roizmanbacteria bacterium]